MLTHFSFMIHETLSKISRNSGFAVSNFFRILAGTSETLREDHTTFLLSIIQLYSHSFFAFGRSLTFHS